MKHPLLTYIALILALLSACSCKKKEEETTTKPSLYGLDFELPPFGWPDASFDLTASDVLTGDGKELTSAVTYKWKVDGGDYTEASTDRKFSTGPLEVGNHLVTCTASDPDDNYYSVTTTKTVIIIDPGLGKTLNGTGIEATDDHITDERGTEEGLSDYFFTHIGELDWFRNNLAWTGAGIAYEETEVTSYPLGRYYTWEEALTACPEGWRLPTDEEWASLGNEAGPLMCDAYLNSKRMWEYWPDVTRTNTTRLAVIPSGYALPATTEPQFKRLYDYAAFWTATESAEDDRLACYRYIHVEENEIRFTYGDKGSLALSVRCVR